MDYSQIVGIAYRCSLCARVGIDAGPASDKLNAVVYL